MDIYQPELGPSFPYFHSSDGRQGMSFTKKDRKTQSIIGRTIPDDSDHDADRSFEEMIAEALHRAFGDTHAAVKIVVSRTKANERAVKNWFTAKNGPSGRHLVDLIRISDEVLDSVLLRANREELVVAKKLADAKQVLIKMVELIGDLRDIDQPTDGALSHMTGGHSSPSVGCSYRRQVQ
jgi:hypothetical protein